MNPAMTAKPTLRERATKQDNVLRQRFFGSLKSGWGVGPCRAHVSQVVNTITDLVSHMPEVLTRTTFIAFMHARRTTREVYLVKQRWELRHPSSWIQKSVKVEIGSLLDDAFNDPAPVVVCDPPEAFFPPAGRHFLSLLWVLCIYVLLRWSTFCPSYKI